MISINYSSIVFEVFPNEISGGLHLDEFYLNLAEKNAESSTGAGERKLILYLIKSFSLEREK